jgi:hypothetical protein
MVSRAFLRLRTLFCGAVLLPLSTAAAQPLDTVALRVGQRVRVTGAPEYQPLSFTALVARVFGGQRGLEVAPVLIALVVLPGTYAGAVIGVAGLKEEWAPARVSEPPR